MPGRLTSKTASAIVHGKGAKERVVLFGEPAMDALETYLRDARPAHLGDPKSRVQNRKIPRHCSLTASVGG